MAIFIAPQWGDLTLTHPQTPRTLSENRSLTYKAWSLSLLLLSQSLALFLSLSHTNTRSNHQAQQWQKETQNPERVTFDPLPQPGCIWREEGKSSQAYRSTQSRKHSEHKASWTVSAPVRPDITWSQRTVCRIACGLIIATIRSAVTWSHGCNCIISASLNLGTAMHGYKCVRKKRKQKKLSLQ